MSSFDPKSLEGTKISCYEIQNYISSGSFGHVYSAIDTSTPDLQKVALKYPSERDQENKSLISEAKVYKLISDPEKGIANMKIIKNKDNQKIIVMDLFGETLETLLTKYKKFKLKTVILLAIQMIDIIRHIHSYGILHRDLKPDNFAIGYTLPNKLFCFDFGLAKKYLKSNGEHIQLSDKKKFVGTARYASINAHIGVEQSRRDDLEAIGYMLVYFYKGKLPWQGLKHKDKKEKYKLIHKKKENTTIEQLCAGMPIEFTKYFQYIKSLDFDEKPSYHAIKKMFFKLYDSRGYADTDKEWCQKKETKGGGSKKSSEDI